MAKFVLYTSIMTVLGIFSHFSGDTKNIMQYGVLGIIAHYYLESNKARDEAKEKHYTALMSSVLEGNKTEINNNTIATKELAETIKKSNKYYDSTITDIVRELNDLKTEYRNISTQTVECFLDDKALSKSNFVSFYKMMTVKHIYQIIIDIYNIVDQNGFDSDKALSLLKENTNRIIERRKSELLLKLKEINYNDSKLDRIKNNIEIYFDTYLDKLNERVFNNLNVSELKTDKNYKRLKQSIKNNMFGLSDTILQDVELM